MDNAVVDQVVYRDPQNIGDVDQRGQADPGRSSFNVAHGVLRLYEQLVDLNANAQNQVEMEKIQSCLDELEQHSQQAHTVINFRYVPLPELYELKAS